MQNLIDVALEEDLENFIRIYDVGFDNYLVEMIIGVFEWYDTNQVPANLVIIMYCYNRWKHSEAYLRNPRFNMSAFTHALSEDNLNLMIQYVDPTIKTFLDSRVFE
jgi:hypothetical protein